MKSSLLFLLILVHVSCQKNVVERQTAIVDYSGNYTSTGYYYHPSVPRDINKPKVLYRHSISSVLCEIGDIPNFSIDDSAWSVILEVDPLTNQVTIGEYPNVTNGPGTITMFTNGLPSPLVSQWPRSNECNNTYDPETKEFKLRYGYYLTTGALRVVEEIVEKD